MKKETINEILKKYKEGTSSLEEQNALFENSNKIEDSISPWIDYVKNKKEETPENFNENQWKSFEKKIDNKPILSLKMMGIAASILLLLSVFIYRNQQSELSYNEKQQLLKEAYALFEDTDKNEENTINQQDIIYENDLLIIYASVE